MSKKKKGKKEKPKREKMSEQEIAEKTEEFLIAKDDFLLVDLIGRVKSSGKIIDVTDEEVARKEGVYDEKDIYGPRLVIVGRGWVIKGVDDILQQMVVGVSKTITIPPAEAFGEKEAKNIKTYSIREVQKHLQKGQKPRPGQTITLEGRRGFIRQIAQGRVRVDFNHPLAGEEIIYEVKVVKKLIDEQEKVIELIKRRIPRITPDKFDIVKEDNTLTISLPKEIYFDQNLPIAKFGIASEIHQYIKGIDTIKYIEIYGKEFFTPTHNHNHKHS
ncbi:MAG: FKBP-type peptidyl-prolyl cis-trans isomerase [Candidatus Helarchaeota archaeon]